MNKIRHLAEQHILESASRLRHIDELMAQARTAASKAEVPAQTAALLSQIEADRNKIAGELASIQGLPPGDDSDLAQRGEGLNGLLAAVGLQLEQALGAVLERGK